MTLEYIEDVAKHIKTFWFRPDKPARYVAGQFTQIQLPLAHPDERGVRHWFTLSSSPTEELIGITTKFAAGKGSTFKHALQDFKPGDELDLIEPIGDFVLPKDKTIPLLFVAGGIGVTPMRSMIKWLTDVHEKREIQLLYSVRGHEELAFTDLFKSYDMQFTPIVTEPDDQWAGETGMLSAERILKHAGSDPRTLIYVSGPEPMVERFVEDFKSLGVPSHRLVTDYFPGYRGI